MRDMWKDSPPLTAYFLRRPDPRNGKDLPGSQHFSMFPALSYTDCGSSQNSQERRTLDDLIPAEETQSWGVSLLPEARAPKPLQSETGPEFGGGGGGGTGPSLFSLGAGEKAQGGLFYLQGCFLSA